MAEKYAVATGNWSDPATWDGGVKPIAGDTVHSNNYTVSIDEDVTVDLITTKAGTTAVSGGRFNIAANGIVVVANVESGTSLCLLNNFGLFTLIGDVAGGTSAQVHGVNTDGSGVTNHIGNTIGGTATLAMGHQINGGTLNITGNIEGGSTGNSYGLRVLNGVVNHVGIANGSSSAPSVYVANGNYIGSEVASLSSVKSLVVISGTAVISKVSMNGSLWPIDGNFVFDNNSSVLSVNVTQQDLSTVTLTDATAAANYPAENEVESGVVFGNTNQFTGTLQVVDTAQLATDLLDDIQTSSHVVAQRLRAAATDDSVGDIVTSTLGAP